jgi:molybdopterin converting factor small subunit
MIVTVKFGIPYCDILSRREFTIEVTKEKTIREMIESFIELNCDFKKQVEARGYLTKGKLKAVYTQNGHLVSDEEKLEDGAIIEVIVPIMGG